MAQAVSRRPLTAEVRVRTRVSPCGICGGQDDSGTGFSPSYLVSPCQHHSTERRGRVVNTSALYSGGARFKSRPGDQKYWAFVVSLSLSERMPG
jgi:hypothetical protein